MLIKCKLTDESGKELFKDLFLPCVGQLSLPQSELVCDARLTGWVWTRSPDKKINAPVIHLDDSQVLLPRSLCAEAKRNASCSFD